MNPAALSKQFIFNEKINSDYLFSLYADDFSYIEEVFLVTLQHMDQDVDAIQAAYAAGSVADMKKGVHKLKPAFGFAGLTDIQQCCAQFEELCGQADDLDVLKADYRQLMALLDEGKLILEKEYRKLKDFNANPL